ncbi:hypothetical protein [Azospirillum soli]|uniref:hypothetical protein n=1 Tax=Azospirillum soli TaxID=1304799 RepID=UPI001AE8687C|nr:hypothetical protein [Azospirillum soli]MBP2316923.1 hypothetical protein [Azospirillum soli]
MVVDLYPDNESRLQRALQLSNDCENLFAEADRQKAAIDKSLADLKASFDKIRAHAPVPFPNQKVEIGRGWVWELPVPVAGILTGIAAHKALTVLWVRFMLSRGFIADAVAARMFGLPSWWRFGQFLGGVVASVAAAFLVQLGIDAVEGAVRRAKLREAIGNLVTPRFVLKRAVMINQEIETALSGFAMIASIQAGKITEIHNVDDLRSIEALLKALASSYEKQAQDRINKVTDDLVVAELKKLDASRGSWTNEDGQPDTTKTVLDITAVMEMAFFELESEGEPATALA